MTDNEKRAEAIMEPLWHSMSGNDYQSWVRQIKAALDEAEARGGEEAVAYDREAGLKVLGVDTGSLTYTEPSHKVVVAGMFGPEDDIQERINQMYAKRAKK